MFISKNKLNHNLIQSSYNNFVQNPEYSFYKTKRESFQHENILLSLKKLGIEINEEEIYEEKISKEIEIKEIKQENISKIYF